MKKIILTLVFGALLLTNNVFAQYGQNAKKNFFLSVGAGKVYDTHGRDLSKKIPAWNLSGGWHLVPSFYMGITMKGSNPVTVDSSLTWVKADSTHSAYQYYKKGRQRASDLLLTFGYVTPGEANKLSMIGGINAGIGASFLELSKKYVQSCFVADVSIEGGIGFDSNNYALLVGCTYAYFGTSYQGFPSDVMTGSLYLKLRAKM